MMRSTLRKVAISLVSVLLAVTAVLAWIATTESGLATTVSIIQKIVPNLTISTTQGRLYDGAQFDDVHYQIDENNDVAIKQLTIIWQAKQLLQGKLMLDSVVINDIALQLTSDDNQPPAETITLPEISLPLAVHIAQLQLSNLTLKQDQQAQQQLVSELQSDIALTGNTLILKQLSVSKHDQFDVAVSGQLQLNEHYQTALAYKWHYKQQDLADVVAKGTLNGDLSELIVEQELLQPVQAQQKLTIQQLLQQLQWQLTISAETIELAKLDNKQQGELEKLLVTASGGIDNAKIVFDSQFSYPDLPVMAIHQTSSSADLNNWINDLSVQLVGQATELSIKGTINDVMAKPHVALTGSWQQLVWPFTGNEPAFDSEQGQFRLTGDSENYQLELNAELTTQQQNLQLDLAAQGSMTQLFLKHLDLKGLGGKAVLSGKADWQTLPVQFDLQAIWNDIFVPEALTSIPMVSQQGSIKLAGSADNYSVSATSELAINSQPVSINLTGQGSSTELSEFKLNSRLASGSAAFTGKLQWQQFVSLLGELKFEHLDPQIVATAWQGQLSGGGHVKFEQTTQGKPRLDITRLAIKGDLRQRPLTVNGELHYADDHLDVRQLMMQSGQSQLMMVGELSDELNFKWQIKSPDLADFYPELAGQLHAEGQLTGAMTTPMITAKLAGQNIAYAERVTVKTISSDLSLDLQKRGQIQADIDLDDMTVDATKVSNTKMRLTGTQRKHQIALDISTDVVNLATNVDGSIDNNTWQGQLTKLDIDAKQAGLWTMTDSELIKISEQKQDIGRHCLSSAQSKVCLAASHDSSDNNWHAGGQITQLPMQLLHAVSVELEQLTGDINGQFLLSGQEAIPQKGNGTFSLDDGKLTLHDAITQQQNISLKQAKIDYQLTDERATATVIIEPEEEGTSPIQGKIDIASMTELIEQPEQAILTGQFSTHIDDLSAFGSFSPAYENLKGRLTIDVDVSGTIGKPVATGDIALDKASVELPSLGLLLTELDAKAKANVNDGITFDYQAKSGEGLLSGHGTVSFDQQGWQLTSDLKGKNVQLVSLPEAYVLASPDLNFVMTANEANVTGKVSIPSAELAPAQFNMTVTPSDDVVIVNQVQMDEKTTFPTTVNVAVSLGDKVFVTGVGFKARLTGDLTISGVTNDVLIGNGEILIKDGGYIAYGQKLTIDDGKVMFAGGAVDNPNLDIKAVRKGSNFTAGLRVQGSAADPQIALFSDPTMDQDDILAHLILGRPLAEASVTDAALLATAATGLGLSGGSQISDQIASTFGLDTLAISGNGGDDTALQVGKYLSPKLYLGYGIGIFEPVSTVTLRYKLSKIWSIKAESGVETGVDFLYTHESKND